MSESTPGPWDFDGPPASRIVWAGPDLRVCFLTSDGPNLGNARLIAAAPELLEAAVWAEGALAPFSKEPAEQSGISRLRRAIAKARGEA